MRYVAKGWYSHQSFSLHWIQILNYNAQTCVEHMSITNFDEVHPAWLGSFSQSNFLVRNEGDLVLSFQPSWRSSESSYYKAVAFYCWLKTYLSFLMGFWTENLNISSKSQESKTSALDPNSMFWHSLHQAQISSINTQSGSLQIKYIKTTILTVCVYEVSWLWHL